MMNRRRALMQSGTWFPLLNITNNYYIDSALDTSDSYTFSTKLSLDKLVGSNSEYVLAVQNDASSNFTVFIYIIPRANIADADVSSVVVPVRLMYCDMEEPMETENMANIFTGSSDVNLVAGTGLTRTGTSSYRFCYYISDASSAPFDFRIDGYDYTGGGGGGGESECPAGGSHDWQFNGTSRLEDTATCISCGTVGYCVAREVVCSYCGELAGRMQCNYCGYLAEVGEGTV